MATTGDALDEIISAIGDPAFPARAGRAPAALTEFDLVAVVAHRPGCPSAILFDDFDRLGCRGGIAAPVDQPPYRQGSPQAHLRQARHLLAGRVVRVRLAMAFGGSDRTDLPLRRIGLPRYLRHCPHGRWPDARPCRQHQQRRARLANASRDKGLEQLGDAPQAIAISAASPPTAAMLVEIATSSTSQSGL